MVTNGDRWHERLNSKRLKFTFAKAREKLILFHYQFYIKIRCDLSMKNNNGQGTPFLHRVDISISVILTIKTEFMSRRRMFITNK